MTRINEVPLIPVYLALLQSGGNRAETPSSSQAHWATKELARTADRHVATQPMAEPFLSSLERELTFPAGFGMGWDLYAHTGSVGPGDGVTIGAGGWTGDDADFLSKLCCWGRKEGCLPCGSVSGACPPT